MAYPTDVITLNSVITTNVVGGLVTSIDIDMTGYLDDSTSVVATINHPVTPVSQMPDSQKIAIASSYIAAEINAVVVDLNTQESSTVTATKVTFEIA